MTELAIDVHGLVKRFGDKAAVDGVDIQMPKGQVWGFLGPNGSGKTTTIRMICGLLKPTEGTGRCLGLDIFKDADRIRRATGYMTQKFSFWSDLTIRENLEFVARLYEMPDVEASVDETVDKLGLTHRQHQLAGSLSGGWKQRMALAAVTMHSPRLLLLDEPTAGVDPQARRDFWDEIHRLSTEGLTVLVSTHYMDEAVRCHRICVVRDGRRAALGRPADFIRALEGRIVEIWGQPTNVLMEALRRRNDVASAAQLGSRVHVLLSPGAPPAEEAVARIVTHLEFEGLKKPGGAAAEPNLEDALVALTQGERLAVGGEAL